MRTWRKNNKQTNRNTRTHELIILSILISFLKENLHGISLYLSRATKEGNPKKKKKKLETPRP